MVGRKRVAKLDPPVNLIDAGCALEIQEETEEAGPAEPSQEDAAKIEKELETDLARLDRANGSYNLHTPLAIYYQARKRFPAIHDREEFNRLFVRYQQAEGSEKQRLGSEIVYRNVGLVFAIALRWRNKGVALEDLVQEGLRVMFEKALPRFDPNRGFKFSTYATWWVKHAIRREIVDRRIDRACRLPVHLHDKLRRLRKLKAKFEAKHGFEPSLEKLSELYGADQESVRELLIRISSDRRPSSLYQKYGSQGDTELIELLDPDEESLPILDLFGQQYAKRHSLLVKQALEGLKPILIDVIKRRFALGVPEETLMMIGDSYNLSRERIRQHEVEALNAIARRLDIGRDEVAALLEYGNEAGLFKPQDPPNAAVLEVDDENAELIFAMLLQHTRHRPASPRPVIVSVTMTLAVRMEIPTNQAAAIIENFQERGWLGPLDADGHAELVRGETAPSVPKTILEPEIAPDEVQPVPPVPDAEPIVLPPAPSIPILKKRNKQLEHEGRTWVDRDVFLVRLRRLAMGVEAGIGYDWLEANTSRRLIVHDERGKTRVLYDLEEARSNLLEKVERWLSTT